MKIKGDRINLLGVYTNRCPACGGDPQEIELIVQHPIINEVVRILPPMLYRLQPCNHFIEGWTFQTPENQVASNILVMFRLGE